MLVEELKKNAFRYENFELWQIDDLNAFFRGNGILKEIFVKEYKMTLESLSSRRSEIPETDAGLMAAILDMVADKYFFVFTNTDANHKQLIEMQEESIMNFDLDISELPVEKVYAMIMDKRSDIQL